MLSLRWLLAEREWVSSFCQEVFFIYACVVPFSCQRPLGVSAYFNNFLCLIQFIYFLIYLFIHSLQVLLTLIAWFQWAFSRPRLYLLCRVEFIVLCLKRFNRGMTLFIYFYFNLFFYCGSRNLPLSFRTPLHKILWFGIEMASIKPMFYLYQRKAELVHCLIVKNISILSYSV